MWVKSDTTVVDLIQNKILVSVDNAQFISVSYYMNMLSNKDNNNMLNYNYTSPGTNIWFKTDTTVIYLIRICILLSVDNGQVIFVSYFKNMLSSKDNNILLNGNQPFQLWICHAELFPQSFS
jgi:hypothetical protein